MVTEQEAEDMRDAIRLLEQKEQSQEKTQNESNLATAQTWFDSLTSIIKNPTDRDEALLNYNAIKSLMQTEKNIFRISILNKEQNLANEKFKELKKLST